MDVKMQATALSSLNDELNGSYLYNALAHAEKDPRLAEVYQRMSAVERKHASIWVERLEASDVTILSFSPNWRTKILAWAAKRFGVGAVLPTVMENERKDTRKYAHTPGGAEMGADEASHNRLLSQVVSTMSGGMGGGAVAQIIISRRLLVAGWRIGRSGIPAKMYVHQSV